MILIKIHFCKNRFQNNIINCQPARNKTRPPGGVLSGCCVSVNCTMSEPPRVISVDGTSQILRKAFFPRWYGLLDTNVAQPAQASSAHSPNTWSAHFDGIRSSVRNKSRQAVEHSSNVLLVADAALACCLYTEMQYSASGTRVLLA